MADDLSILMTSLFLFSLRTVVWFDSTCVFTILLLQLHCRGYMDTAAVCPSNRRIDSWPLTAGWSVLDVANFVRDCGFPQYAKCFIRQTINGEKLARLNEFDLQRLGVGIMSDAVVLLAAIKSAVSKRACNQENLDLPPNVFYPPMGHSNLDPAAPPPPLRLPKLNSRRLCLPYRDQGDRSYRYTLGPPSFNNRCSVLGKSDRGTERFSQ